MSSCFGLRKNKSQSDREPLLPQYEDDTELQRKLHQKLHTYQMFRALSKGFMPSTEQLIINLRTILASDVLNPDNDDLSQSGRRLVKYTRTWLQQFMDLLQHKNSEDQLQDLIWFLSKSKISVDVDDIAQRARKSKAQADTAAAYQSLKTVGSLLLTNSDFRVFLSDLNVVGREVFKDSAFALSDVAQEAGKKLEPSAEEQRAIAEPGADADKVAPSTQDLENEAADVTKVVANGSAQVARTAAESTADRLSGDEGKTLINRLKQAVIKLRQRNDYSDSVSTLSLLLQRYATAYSRVAEDVADVASQDVQENKALDRAMHNMWLFVTSFGDKKEWDKCEQLWKQVMTHKQSDPQFEQMMTETGNSLQKLLTDADFLDKPPEKFQELKDKYQKTGKDSKLNDDLAALVRQIEITLQSVLQDEDIHNLVTTTLRIFRTLSPLDRNTNPELLQDAINVFVPLLIATIQYVPIPRVEVSTPEVDLLLENLIIEPGKTVNQTSFLPYRLKVETYNDLEIRKAKLRTTTAMTNLVTIKLDGLSLKAEEIGFWMRAHKGILRLFDEGIASFALDERGVDIHVDVEIARERMEQILTLKAVRVHIHKLNYHLRQSKFSWFGWLLKPLLRPIVRKTMERQLATALADFFHTANRELLFARERLRATRIADPQDLMTFFKAVADRLTPAEDPDLYTRVGIAQPGKGVFKGVYAPGSIVKVWNEEGARAEERIEDFEEHGWRNEIFDTHVRNFSHSRPIGTLPDYALSYRSSCTVSELQTFVQARTGLTEAAINTFGRAEGFSFLTELDESATFRFLDLFPELRHSIYDYLFAYDDRKYTRPHLAILRTCLPIHHEASDILHTKGAAFIDLYVDANNWIFAEAHLHRRHTITSKPAVAEHLGRAMLHITPFHTCHITLHFTGCRLPAYRTERKDPLRSILATLDAAVTICTGLKRLEVRVGPNAAFADKKLRADFVFDLKPLTRLSRNCTLHLTGVDERTYNDFWVGPRRLPEFGYMYRREK